MSLILKESFVFSKVVLKTKINFSLGSLIFDYPESDYDKEFMVFIHKTNNYVFLKPFLTYDSFFFNLLFENDNVVKIPLSVNASYVL